MDPSSFDPAFPFPVPTGPINLEFPYPPPPPPPMSAALHHQIPSANQALPPYPEMIKAAIAALKEPYGSTMLAISGYMERVYGNLPHSHSEEIAAWLQAMKRNGDIVKVGNCFAFPNYSLLAPLSAPPGPGGASAHRKRGRPRKLKPTTEPNLERTVEREPVKEANGGVLVEATAVVPKKRAGRPVKRFEVEPGNGAAENKGRGRPKKNKQVVLSGPLGYPKKGPGRPPKSRFLAEVSDGPVKTLAITGVKNRGRPRSSPGADGLVLKRIGGRPTNVGSRLLGPADPQWMVDYAQVRAKIECIQSKMRNAIGVIKPRLMNQIMSNGDVGTALQELEQISTMDVLAVSLTDPGEEPEETSET